MTKHAGRVRLLDVLDCVRDTSIPPSPAHQKTAEATLRSSDMVETNYTVIVGPG